MLGKLSQLTLLKLDIYFARSLFSQGIEWTKSINKNSNKSVFRIEIGHKEFPFIDSYLKINTLFPDHDFCIYKNFPFKNKVALDVSDGFIYDKLNFTCTFNYIRLKNFNFSTKFTGYYSKLFDGEKIDCDFSKMKKNCEKKIYLDKQDLREFIVFTEFLFTIVLNPIVGFLVFILNVCVIFLLKSVKSSNPNLFFIKCYSFISCLFIFFQLLSLINRCSFKTGIFCSSIRTKILVQYFKKYFIDFFSEILKFLFNFLLLSYNFYRLMLLSDSKFRLFPLQIGIIFFFFSILALILNWSNFIHSQINYSKPNLNYPISNLNSENLQEPPKMFLKYLNALNKVVNYGLFYFFNFTIDFLIIRKIREIITHKKKIINSQNNKKTKKLNQINFSILRKTLINLIINLILKIPEVLPVFYSFTFFSTENLKNLNFTQFDIFIEDILIKYGLESLFESVCAFLFSLSLLNNFYFYFVSNKFFKTIFFHKFFPSKKLNFKINS